MRSMREKTKVILFIALLAFVGLIFFDWGMQSGRSGGGRGADGPVIGKVNGRDITGEHYRRVRAGIVEGFEQRTGRSPGFGDLDAIEEETWLRLVQDELLQEQIEKHGIEISDAEILETLKTNPPAEIRAGFTNEQGQFDVAAYQQALADPARAAQWASVEAYLRATMPVDKLTNYVALNAHVTNAEVRDRFLAENEKLKAAYVASSPARVDLPEDAVSESDLRSYYEQHVEDFRSAEQAVLEFVRIPKTPSAEDSSDTKADLEDIRQQILEGAEFSEVAATWSDDASAQRGGSLGLISHGDMVPEFETVAFSTPAGEVSPVFSTPFGYHIVKVDSVTTEGGEEKRAVRHILLRVEASNYTLRDAADRMDDFLETVATSGDFATAAADHDLAVETTPPFERRAAIPGVGLNRAAERFAFSAKPGDVTPEAIEDESNLYAFRLVETRPPGVLPFEEVEEEVDSLVRQEKRRKLARERLENAVSSSDGTLAGIADALGGEVDTTIEFSREAFVPGVGRRNAFVATAFALGPDERSGLVESDRGFYVLKVVERIPADETQLAEQTPRLREQILREKRQLMIQGWLEELMTEAEIVDFRSGQGVPWSPDPSQLTYRPEA
jgi:peptidylprolyl isomerase/peptidyl-prolyl cis-trans isomerase D